MMDMYITASSATDIYYLVRKHLHSADQAKQVMEKLYSLVGILTVSGAECIDAPASSISDYEDAVVERVSVKADMDYIITGNVKDYQQGMVKAFFPNDFIILMNGKISLCIITRLVFLKSQKEQNNPLLHISPSV